MENVKLERICTILTSSQIQTVQLVEGGNTCSTPFFANWLSFYMQIRYANNLKALILSFQTVHHGTCGVETRITLWFVLANYVSLVWCIWGLISMDIVLCFCICQYLQQWSSLHPSSIDESWVQSFVLLLKAAWTWRSWIHVSGTIAFWGSEKIGSG